MEPLHEIKHGRIADQRHAFATQRTFQEIPIELWKHPMVAIAFPSRERLFFRPVGHVPNKGVHAFGNVLTSGLVVGPNGCDLLLRVAAAVRLGLANHHGVRRRRRGCHQQQLLETSGLDPTTETQTRHAQSSQEKAGQMPMGAAAVRTARCSWQGSLWLWL